MTLIEWIAIGWAAALVAGAIVMRYLSEFGVVDWSAKGRDRCYTKERTMDSRSKANGESFTFGFCVGAACVGLLWIVVAL